MTDIESTPVSDLAQRFGPEIDALISLLGPIGAIPRYVSQRYLLSLSAAERYGATIAGIAAAIHERPALGALVISALDATRRSADDSKARAFGRAIAAGFGGDDAAVDFNRQIVQSIDRIEMPHIEAMETLRQASSYSGGIAKIEEDFGRATAANIVAVLEGEGLISNANTNLVGEIQLSEVTGNIDFISPYAHHVREYLLNTADERA